MPPISYPPMMSASTTAPSQSYTASAAVKMEMDDPNSIAGGSDMPAEASNTQGGSTEAEEIREAKDRRCGSEA